MGAITAAASFILLSEKVQKSLISILVSFATGILLTSSFLALIPNAIEEVGEAHDILPVVLGGILFFFFLEKLLIWRNCQNNSCEVHGTEAVGSIVLIGDAFHNFTDGIVIAASFLTSTSLGFIASISIIVHEIPQETGDFGILLHSGFTRKKAYLYNTLSSISTIPAAIIGYFVLDAIHEIVPFMLAISASSFIYIALSDLAPELHRKTTTKDYIKQLILVLVGTLLMTIILSLGVHEH
ncbi:MAG: ZIP family metal transporter [Promethearchaeota archaeon]